ncbi:MAG: WD40 repeat domain-containing serine/threonine protein kinase [Chloroflexota bacterium]
MTEQKIGRYEIKSELGRGGMATVYRAYDPRFEREVAIKVLPRELLHDPQFRVRFEREAKTIAALEHPAIVPVYDVGDEDGQPYFVMRCMTGGSLADTIGQGPMQLGSAARIMERIAPAMDEAHSKGIVHRDLKPGNILFDRGGEPYVSDFGIAKMTQSQGTTVTGGVIIGTPAYMSPEQAQGEKVDGRSDVYALGVILYEMLSGVQPYQATTPMAIVVKHITDPIPHILDKAPNLPAGIEAVIEKAMAKNPAERFGSAGEFSLALTAIAGGQSADDAIKTASINATKLNLPKTQMVASKTIANQAGGQPAAGFSLKIPLFILGGLLVICFLSVAAFGIFRVCPGGMGFLPWCGTPAVSLPSATVPAAPTVFIPTEPPAVPTTAPLIVLTVDIPPTEVKSTDTPVPTSVPVTTPSLGGADKIAFISGNEVWLMNLDGTDLKALTSDKAPKKRLQWIPGTNSLVFISGNNVFSVDSDTLKFDTVMSFPFAMALDEFRISPDAKQVAISLNKEMYVVPFDLAKLKTARSRDGLVSLKGCLNHMGKTPTAIILKQFRWRPTDKVVAWLFGGVSDSNKLVDIVRLMDISSCDPLKLGSPKDEFPSLRFTPEGFVSKPLLPDFDWDGGFLFLMNTFDRNNGWGFLYSYNSELHRGNQENPISSSKSHCCSRDARFSPDGTYVVFAFMNKDDPGAPEQFYYIPTGSIQSGTEFTPIAMPADFFKDPKEAPQFALHPAAP